MKTFLLLLSIGLALAIPMEVEIEAGRDFLLNEYPSEYPKVTTVFDLPDYSKLSIDDLLEAASHHSGLEFLNDTDAAASMGIDLMNLHPDLIYDATTTTVRSIL